MGLLEDVNLFVLKARNSIPTSLREVASLHRPTAYETVELTGLLYPTIYIYKQEQKRKPAVGTELWIIY